MTIGHDTLIGALTIGHDTLIGALTIGHDTLIGALLIIAGALTIAYAQNNAPNLRMAALLGAVVTIVIGLLLIFGLA